MGWARLWAARMGRAGPFNNARTAPRARSFFYLFFFFLRCLPFSFSAPLSASPRGVPATAGRTAALGQFFVGGFAGNEHTTGAPTCSLPFHS